RERLDRYEYRFLHPGDMPYLGFGVRTGAVTLQQVLPEIRRYEKDIRDPSEVERLVNWAEEMKPVAGRRVPSLTLRANVPARGFALRLRCPGDSGRSRWRRPPARRSPRSRAGPCGAYRRVARSDIRES